jgi:hypothetical protein
MVMDEFECLHHSKYDEWKILNIYCKTNIDTAVEKFIQRICAKQNSNVDHCRKYISDHVKALITENRTILNLLRSQNITNISSEFKYEWPDMEKHDSEDDAEHIYDYSRLHQDFRTKFWYRLKHTHDENYNILLLDQLHRADWYLVVVWKGYADEEDDAIKSYLTNEAVEGKSSLTREAVEGKPSLTNEAVEGKPSLTREAVEGKPSLTNEAVEGKPFLINESKVAPMD